MVFPNLVSMLRIGSPLSSVKLILIAGIFSRPRFSAVFRTLLQPFVHDGQVPVRYRCYGRWYQIFLRLSDLDSDLLTSRELGVKDVYQIEEDFMPDLIVDGGGNIGLFSLRATALLASVCDSRAKVVVCEPLPRNVQQIQKHLNANGVEAEILPVCLGGERRSVPFYCREAIRSSFDPKHAYTNVIDIPVYVLQDVVGAYPAKRILIKLDIEGMELETLRSFVPEEQRAVYIVGELHNYERDVQAMQHVFEASGWSFEFYDIADNASLFRACSPAAAPLLKWARQQVAA